jgi:hypothetical protein
MTKSNTNAAASTATKTERPLSPKYQVALVVLVKNGEISRVNGFGTMQLRTLQQRGFITAKGNATKKVAATWKALGRKGQAAARKLYNEHFAS